MVYKDFKNMCIASNIKCKQGMFLGLRNYMQVHDFKKDRSIFFACGSVKKDNVDYAFMIFTIGLDVILFIDDEKEYKYFKLGKVFQPNKLYATTYFVDILFEEYLEKFNYILSNILYYVN